MVKLFLTYILAFFVVGCANLNPVSTSSKELDLEKQLVTDLPVDELELKLHNIFKDLKWSMLYEGEKIPNRSLSGYSNRNPMHSSNFDLLAWEKALKSDVAPYKFIQLKTPTSLSSYGASIFVVIYKKDNGSELSVAASTGQIAEKKKLSSYILEISNRLNAN